MLLVLAGAASVGTVTTTALERASMPNLSAIGARGRTARLCAPWRRNCRPTSPAPRPRSSARRCLPRSMLPRSPRTPAVQCSAPASTSRSSRCSIMLASRLPRSTWPAPSTCSARSSPATGSLRCAAATRCCGWLRPPGDALRRRSRAAPRAAGLATGARAAGSLHRGRRGRWGNDPRRGRGARRGTTVVDGLRSGRSDPLPARLRSAATQALLDGARTVIVESNAALVARRAGSRTRCSASVRSPRRSHAWTANSSGPWRRRPPGMPRASWSPPISRDAARASPPAGGADPRQQRPARHRWTHPAAAGCGGHDAAAGVQRAGRARSTDRHHALRDPADARSRVTRAVPSRSGERRHPARGGVARRRAPALLGVRLPASVRGGGQLALEDEHHRLEVWREHEAGQFWGLAAAEAVVAGRRVGGPGRPSRRSAGSRSPRTGAHARPRRPLARTRSPTAASCRRPPPAGAR